MFCNAKGLMKHFDEQEYRTGRQVYLDFVIIRVLGNWLVCVFSGVPVRAKSKEITKARETAENYTSE